MSIPTNNLTTVMKKKWFLISLVLVVIIGCTVGLIIYRHHTLDKKKLYEATLPSIKVSLKNGCGFEGAVTDMTEFLSDKNIDIVATGNADKFIYNKTIIVVKKMDNADLLRLMKITGIQQWTLATSDYSVASFVIIIGKDYEEIINSQKNKQE
jgi:alpha-N-acetylglucosamine transferase